MRAIVLLSSAVVLLLSGTVFAQTWINHADRDLRFAIDFPGEPTVNDISYTTRQGTSVPARQFSLERDDARYILTVVDYSSGPSADEQVAEHAAEMLRQRGEVRIAGSDAYDPGIPGRQLSILERDGRQLLASIYMHDHRLYIAEASVALGSVPPVQFQQSLTLLDPNGDELASMLVSNATV